MISKKVIVFNLFYFICLCIFSQQEDTLQYEPYRLGFPFKEGIYLNFEEFKLNQPSILNSFEGRGDELQIYDDSLDKMVPVYADRVWGYSQSGNIYVSEGESFWRVIHIGNLAQYSAIVVTKFTSIDQFGFPVESYAKNMKSLFFDMTDGSKFELNQRNVEAYLEDKPQLKEQFKKRRKKTSDLMMILRAYNELNPIYFPVYE